SGQYGLRVHESHGITVDTLMILSASGPVNGVVLEGGSYNSVDELLHPSNLTVGVRAGGGASAWRVERTAQQSSQNVSHQHYGPQAEMRPTAVRNLTRYGLDFDDL